ncbi:glutaredoxin [Cryptomeria japonica]|uniref:glutaredoxin n=1 Tax=Cryptomeria japonica TaxID=3369 RepID=UPI0025AC1B36|nr:glutaredoxin [Cryptomeria japonica]
MATAMEKAKSIVSSHPVVVFSKTSCPYCKQVKQLLATLRAKTEVVELDTTSDGPDVQAALKEWTGQRTVPNVFIGGTHIGGCDDTVAKHKNGQLVPLLSEAGAL